MKIKHFYLLLAVLLQTTIYAQHNGRIYGIVGDSNGILPGAKITLGNLQRSTETDLNGEFSLNNVPDGTYTLIVSYLGYADLQETFTIQKGEHLDVGALDFSSVAEELDVIVINSYQAPSQARAYNIQKNAAGIMNVIASDAIGKLPDRNAAEAVQRISGVSIERDHGEGRYVTVRGTPLQWNSTLINGNRMPTSEG